MNSGHIEQEHVRWNEKGNIGVYRVRSDDNRGVHSSFLNDAYWEQIDIIVGAYTKVHPREMELYVRGNAEESGKTIKNVSSGNLELRHRVRLPVSLLRALEEFDAELFVDTKLYQGFRERFPGLTICQKVQ